MQTDTEHGAKRTILTDTARRTTARIAPYRAAITTARAAGLTWGDLARCFGGVNPDRLRWAYKHGARYPAEQLPLPEPAPIAKLAQPQAQGAMPAGKKFFDSLPKVGGFKDITPR